MFVERIKNKICVCFFKLFNKKFRKCILYAVPKIYFKNKCTIGKRTSINNSVFIHADGGVTIGENCTLSYGATILSIGFETHGWKNRDFSNDCHVLKSVIIGNNVWICANVTVCPGVTIGDNVIIAAGSIVVHNCFESGIYAGNPARKVKDV